MTKLMITRSRKLLIYLIVVHSVMLTTLLSLLAISWCWGLASILVLVSLIYYLRQHQWLKSKRSLMSIDYDVDKGWLLNYSDGWQKSGLKLMGCFVTPHLVMLYFNRRYFWQSDVVTIINDAVDAELFRQLRVYLKSPKTFQQ
ncbi:hypothetical protein LCGC14_1039380 [marine sediment metagenome]|uniref:YcxB-like protein domain-containing protein n=1 Tax=marine sediment metagenome TaxID=412755 RepID=A0A0F9MS89_9ZZZZ|nr:hypothetical protein [Methylophaga sp.]HEC60368.1 hypothetical protein [Methylophaga sp.]